MRRILQHEEELRRLRLRRRSLNSSFRSQCGSFCGELRPRGGRRRKFSCCALAELSSFAPGTLMNSVSPVRGFIEEMCSDGDAASRMSLHISCLFHAALTASEVEAVLIWSDRRNPAVSTNSGSSFRTPSGLTLHFTVG